MYANFSKTIQQLLSHLNRDCPLLGYSCTPQLCLFATGEGNRTQKAESNGSLIFVASIHRYSYRYSGAFITPHGGI